MIIFACWRQARMRKTLWKFFSLRLLPPAFLYFFRHLRKWALEKTKPFLFNFIIGASGIEQGKADFFQGSRSVDKKCCEHACLRFHLWCTKGDKYVRETHFPDFFKVEARKDEYVTNRSGMTTTYGKKYISIFPEELAKCQFIPCPFIKLLSGFIFPL